METQRLRRGPSAIMMFALGLLSLVTVALAAIAIDGFAMRGWLRPFWNSMTDAQASIIAQLIFFLAAAWASILVPLLFGSQLQSLQEAAASAQNTFGEISGRLDEIATRVDDQLKASAAESKKQFSSILRYQQLALGSISSDGLLAELDDDQKKAFIDTAWQTVEPKLLDALKVLHGQTQKWVSGGGNYRSDKWWERVKESKALGDFYQSFRTISDAKWKASHGTLPGISEIVSANAAAKRIQEFNSSEQRDDATQ